MIPKYLILASSSPRRQELLSLLVSDYRVEALPVDETPFQDEPAFDYAQRVALDKAMTVAERYHTEEVLILAADTIVVCEKKIFGKPRDQEDAVAMLMQL